MRSLGATLSLRKTRVLNGIDPAAAIVDQYNARGRTSSRALHSFIDYERTEDQPTVLWQDEAVSRLTVMWLSVF